MTDIKNGNNPFENKYHAIIEKAGEGIIVFQDYKIKFYNKSALEISGYSARELTGAPFLDFIHPDDRDFVLNEYEQRISGIRDKAQYKVRLLTKSNLYRIVSANSVSFEWDGKPATLVFLSDITEQEEQNLQILIDGANNAVGVRDKNGSLIKWNEAFTMFYMDFFGIKAGFGQKPVEIPPDARINKSNVTNVTNETIKKKNINEIKKIVFKHEQPDGDIRYYEKSLMPTRAGQRFYATIEFIQEVTSTILYEQELNKKHRILEESQRIAHLGSWEWDIEENKLEWSDEIYRIIGASRGEVGDTYEAFLQLVHPEDLESVRRSVERALSDPSYKYNILHRIIRPDGKERYVRERGEVILNDHGVAERMIGTAQDLTGIKILEDEIRRLRQELSHIDRVSLISEMSASLAHELNQPLSAILSNSQAALRFLKMDPPDINEVREILEDIVNDDKRAGRVINSLRAMLKKREPVIDTWDVNELILEVLNIANSDVLLKDTLIKYEAAPGLPLVRGDRVQTQQVLLNLILNAMDAMEKTTEDKGTLEIGAETRENQNILVYVRDSGKGIGEDDFPNIFNPFYTTKSNGLGMGLSICKTIMSAQNGRLWAENNPDKGATFYFTLPFVKGDQE